MRILIKKIGLDNLRSNNKVDQNMKSSSGLAGKYQINSDFVQEKMWFWLFFWNELNSLKFVSEIDKFYIVDLIIKFKLS